MAGEQHAAPLVAALLADFERASDAVSAALDFQVELAKYNAKRDDYIRPTVRVGIAMGEVIIADNTITGAGVVLAQRLEQFSEPGGVVIQGAVQETIPKRLPFDYNPLGECELKGFDEPVRAYSVSLKSGATIPKVDLKREEPVLDLPDKPSIAVLPFKNMSADPEQEYFSDGIAEDIITALSRYRWFFVIARNSSFVYKGCSVDIVQTATELGVQYVLEGSVRKAGNRIRVSVRLIDALTGHHIWADRYDRDLDDIFTVQDSITDSIVTAIEPELGAAERERARRKPPESLDAWDLYQRGLWHFYTGPTPDSVTKAKKFFEKTCNRDPNFAAAYADLSWAHTLEVTLGFTVNPELSLEEAAHTAERAVALDSRDPSSHVALGRVHLLRHSYDRAVSEMQMALELNPSFARAHNGLGMALLFGGKPAESIPHFEMANRTNPRAPNSWTNPQLIAHAYLNLGQYDEALEWSLKATQQVKAPFMPFAIAVAIMGHLGLIDEARLMLAEVKNRNPHFSVDTIRKTTALYGSHSGADRIIEGLRMVGLEN